MASAQVLPNMAGSSRKQEHLEAGRRRLEEFRKKKAADRAKKAASTSHTLISDASLHEKRPLENEHVQNIELDGIGPSEVVGGSVIEPSTTNKNRDKNISDQSFSNGTKTVLLLPENDSVSVSKDLMKTHANELESMTSSASGFSGSVVFNQKKNSSPVNSIYGTYNDASSRSTYWNTSTQSIPLHLQASPDFDSSTSQSSFQGINGSWSKRSDDSLKEFSVSNHGSAPALDVKFSSQNSFDTLLQAKYISSSYNESGYANGSSYEVNNAQHANNLSASASENMHSHAAFNDSAWRGASNSSFSGTLAGLHGAAMKKSDFASSDVGIFSNNMPSYSVTAESNFRRSRPSFLDSLNVPRHSSGTSNPRKEAEKVSTMSNNLETDKLGPFPNSKTPNAPNASERLMDSSVSAGNSHDVLGARSNDYMIDGRPDFYSSKQNEDFAALEQHIEDLTQEKFSLQRALEASRALAESLAAENSSLTDNYNRQRSVVNQLKFDMEKLQEEIKGQLVELEAVKTEYSNAQLECNASDERAKLLASEVIGLEEKALRLRSNELKLEKQLENAEVEISSCKKKMSSLEKERHDLQSTIDALQEEKKLLQSKIRKASGSVIIDTKNPVSKKDVSTSTEDLDAIDAGASNSNQEVHVSAVPDGDGSSLSLLPEDGHSVNIPHDQIRVIENINALIAELALEKEELIQALMSESSHCSMLKELNKDLTQKLEFQTQRLELLTAQSMAAENIPAKQPIPQTLHDHTQYADEGDEVVERVLGWIMKLFPGGPSRQRTSKLL